MIILRLPWPPSVNTYWRHPTRGKLAGRHLISRAGREYRAHVAGIVMAERVRRIAGRLEVTMHCYPPDRRARDLDNLPKGVLDALQHSGVYRDDSQIDALHIYRGAAKKPGHVRISVREAVSAPRDSDFDAEQWIATNL